MSNENLIGNNIQNIGTGSNTPKYTTIVYPFDMYEIVVKLTIDGKFVSIEEVRVNKDFRTYKNKTQQQTIFAEINELPTETQTE